MAERYPTVRAGQKVTGELLDSMLPKVARKTADTSRSTTTLSADPEHQMTLEANAGYVLEAIVVCSNTTGADDINIDWTAPGTTDGSWGGIGPAVNLAADSGDGRFVGTAVTSSRSWGTGTGGASTPTIVMIRGILITGSTAGTYSMDWAQLSAAGTLTVFADSHFSLRRIA